MGQEKRITIFSTDVKSIQDKKVENLRINNRTRVVKIVIQTYNPLEFEVLIRMQTYFKVLHPLK